jgi:hypothetical protein
LTGDRILGSGTPRILPDSFDEDNQQELQKIVDEWSLLFNDPNGVQTPGVPSNFGLTEETADAVGNTWRYSTRKANVPPIYLETADGSEAHFMDDEGNHLVSAVIVQNPNGVDEVKYIASDYAKEQIKKSQTPERADKPTFIQRVVGKFRRQKPIPQSGQTQPSARTRARTLVLNPQRSGLRFSKTTTGPQMPDESQLNQLQKNALSTVVKTELDNLSNSFSKKLGRQQNDTNPIQESEVIDWIDNLRKTDSRRAGIEETNLHNFIVFSEIEQTQDLNFVNNLKPTMRSNVLKQAGINSAPGVDEKKRRPFNPYGQQQTSTPTAPATPATPATPSTPGAVSTPPARPLPQNPTPSQPAVAPTKPIPTLTGSGPQITPGLGNPALNISYDEKLGLYIDNSTGEYVEDLSNLVIDQHAIYDPSPLSLDDGPNYGTEFPSLPSDPNTLMQKNIPYEVVAPGVDPNTPSLEITARPLTSASKIHKSKVASSFTRAIRIRLEQHNKPNSSKKIRNENLGLLRQDLVYVDARGALPGIANPLLSDLDVVTARNLAKQAAANNEILKDPTYLDGTLVMQTPGAKVFDSSKTGYGDSLLGGFNGDPVGLREDLPIGEFYLPTPGGSRAPQTAMITALNTALQLEHAASNPKQGSTQAEIDDLRRAANNAWINASDELSGTYRSISAGRNMALQEWRRKRSLKKQTYLREQDDYIVQGMIVEQAQLLLDKHILNNPNAMAAIDNAKRGRMQERAKRINDRVRAIAARRAAGLPRAGGLYDDKPEILDPWNSPSPPTAPRQAAEIFKIRDEHRSQTLFDKITHGSPSNISDEQIEMLDVIGDLWDQSQARVGTITGPQNSLIAGQVFDNVGVAHLKAVWEYNGYTSLPVLASRDEIISALKETMPNGEPKYVLISRGVGGQAGATAAQQVQMVADALTGDRFIPGQGGKASGVGEYWSQNPNNWKTYHGKSGGTMVALVSRDGIMTNRKSYGEIFGPQSAGYGGETYESIWALYNAFGAPNSQGTNSSHGKNGVYGIAIDSLKPNPQTGTLSAQQLADLDAHIDRLTSSSTPITQGRTPDSGWGRVTLEGMKRDGRLSQSLDAALFPPLRAIQDKSGPTPEELKEIEATRDLWNAWLQQRLVHVSDLVKRLEDESTGGQAAKDNNAKMWRAIRTHMYMRGENIAAMMGYDGFAAEGVSDRQITPSQLWKAVVKGDVGRFTILNRSAMILEDGPIANYTVYKPILESIIYPDGTNATRKYGLWG